MLLKLKYDTLKINKTSIEIIISFSDLLSAIEQHKKDCDLCDPDYPCGLCFWEVWKNGRPKDNFKPTYENGD